MKITSWNVNGLRSPSMSVLNKDKTLNEESNLFRLLKDYNPDILCLCETKTQVKNEELFDVIPFQYKLWNSSTDKLGYSGVSVFSKVPFVNLGKIKNLEDYDNFGRYLLLEFENFILLHAYVPNSGAKKFCDSDEYRNHWDKIIYKKLKKIKKKIR